MNDVVELNPLSAPEDWECPDVKGMHIAEPLDTSIKFLVAGNTLEILKLCANGDIFVKGELVENDKQVVDAMRTWLGYHQSESPLRKQLMKVRERAVDFAKREWKSGDKDAIIRSDAMTNFLQEIDEMLMETL